MTSIPGTCAHTVLHYQHEHANTVNQKDLTTDSGCLYRLSAKMQPYLVFFDGLSKQDTSRLKP